MSPASRVVAGTRFTSRPFPPALLGWPVPFGGDFSSLTAGVFRPTTVSLPFIFFLLTRLLFSFWASQMYSLCLSLLRCPFQPAPQAFHFGFLSCCVLNLQEPFGIDARSLPSLQGRVPSWHSPSPPACFFVSVFWFLPIMYTLSAEV